MAQASIVCPNCSCGLELDFLLVRKSVSQTFPTCPFCGSTQAAHEVLKELQKDADEKHVMFQGFRPGETLDRPHPVQALMECKNCESSMSASYVLVNERVVRHETPGLGCPQCGDTEAVRNLLRKAETESKKAVLYEISEEY